MTVLVVMQPDFGATRGRALIRAAGTLAGVLVAAAILSLTDDAVAWQIALAILVFLTAAFSVRISYGFFVACLTPMIIILLALHAPGEGWHFALQRIEETWAALRLQLPVPCSCGPTGYATGYRAPSQDRSRRRGPISRQFSMPSQTERA